MIKISPSELAGFRSWLNSQTSEVKEECRVVIADISHEFVTSAKNKVNVYKTSFALKKGRVSKKGRSYKSVNIRKGPHGNLMSKIDFMFSSDGLSALIYADTNYAAYQEFGTGDLVSIEPGYEDVAMEYKGKGIKKINVPPKSYFFSNFERANKRLIHELNKMGFR